MVIKEAPEKWEWIKTTRFKIGNCEEDKEDEGEPQEDEERPEEEEIDEYG